MGSPVIFTNRAPSLKHNTKRVSWERIPAVEKEAFWWRVILTKTLETSGNVTFSLGYFIARIFHCLLLSTVEFLSFTYDLNNSLPSGLWGTVIFYPSGLGSGALVERGPFPGSKASLIFLQS